MIDPIRVSAAEFRALRAALHRSQSGVWINTHGQLDIEMNSLMRMGLVRYTQQPQGENGPFLRENVWFVTDKGLDFLMECGVSL